MRVLLTGATGLLGHHLIAALGARGATLRALVLPGEDASHLEAQGVTVFRGDVCDPNTLTAPLSGAETVFHLAGMMGQWRPLADYMAVNATGTRDLCKAALAAGVRRVVHVSSWTVYGMGLGRPAREDFPLKPFVEPYALTKAAGDRIVQRYIAERGLPAVIVRPATFFGPGDRLHFGRMADRLRAGSGLVVGRGQNALPFVYVSDVVQGLLLAADHERAVGQAYNIGNDWPMTQEAILRAIAAETGAPPPRLHAPYAALYAAAFAAEQVAALTRARRQPIVTRLGVKLFGGDNRLAIDKARAELGYEPQVPLREGLARTAEWYRREAVEQETVAPHIAAA